MPKVSVIVPVYNVENYLHETIESVVDQTIGFEENIQLILVNDRSRLIVLIERRRVADFPTQARIIENLDGLLQRHVAHVRHLYLLAVGSENVDKQQGYVAQSHEGKRHQRRVHENRVTVTEAVKASIILVIVIAHGNPIISYNLQR